MMRVTVNREGKPPLTFDLFQSEARLGRAAENDIQLLANSVSKHHATLRAEGQRLELVDAGSTNGTFLNGERISGSCELTKGDVIWIDPFEVLVEHVSEPGPTTVLDAVVEPTVSFKPSHSAGSQVKVDPRYRKKKPDFVEE